MAGLIEFLDLSEHKSANLVEFCSQHGFAKLIGHSFPDAQLEELFAWSREFFAWPDDVKQSASRSKTGPFRGYAGVGCESIGIPTKGSAPLKDVKESFDVGCPNDHTYPTPWPIGHARCDEFRKFMQSFYQDCRRVHVQILQVLEQALDLKDGDLRALCSDGNGEIRLVRYPAIPVAELRTGTTFRVGEHKDVGVLTLLFQDSVGGLEAEDTNVRGRFSPVTSNRLGEMILMVGETLQRWTAGHMHSARHRVKEPPGSRDDQVLPDRYAVGFFGKANRMASMAPLGRFTDCTTADGIDEGQTVQDFYNCAHEQTATA